MGAATPLIERLSRFVEIEQNMGCWLWQGACTKNGYAQIGIDQRARYAHRVSYELFCGPVPEGKELDHICRVRNCINPNHLEPVTRRENVHRSPIAVTAIHSRKTECPRCGSPYSPRGKGRYCAPCDRIAQRRRRAGKN